MQITRKLMWQLGGGFAALIASGAAVGYAVGKYADHQRDKEYNALNPDEREAVDVAVRTKHIQNIARQRAGSQVTVIVPSRKASAVSKPKISAHIEIEPPELDDDDKDERAENSKIGQGPLGVEGFIEAMCNANLDKGQRQKALQLQAAYEIQDYEGALQLAAQLREDGVLLAPIVIHGLEMAMNEAEEQAA